MTYHKSTWVQFMPAVIIAAGIAVISLWENPQVPRTLQMNDKLAHGLMYMALAVAMTIPAIRQWGMRVPVVIPLWTLATAYGACMEVAQQYCTSSRAGQIDDVFANAIGAAIGVAIICLLFALITKHD